MASHSTDSVNPSTSSPNTIDIPTPSQTWRTPSPLSVSSSDDDTPVSRVSTATASGEVMGDAQLGVLSKPSETPTKPTHDVQGAREKEPDRSASTVQVGLPPVANSTHGKMPLSFTHNTNSGDTHSNHGHLPTAPEVLSSLVPGQDTNHLPPPKTNTNINTNTKTNTQFTPKPKSKSKTISTNTNTASTNQAIMMAASSHGKIVRLFKYHRELKESVRQLREQVAVDEARVEDVEMELIHATSDEFMTSSGRDIVAKLQRDLEAESSRIDELEHDLRPERLAQVEEINRMLQEKLNLQVEEFSERFEKLEKAVETTAGESSSKKLQAVEDILKTGRSHLQAVEDMLKTCSKQFEAGLKNSDGRIEDLEHNMLDQSQRVQVVEEDVKNYYEEFEYIRDDVNDQRQRAQVVEEDANNYFKEIEYIRDDVNDQRVRIEDIEANMDDKQTTDVEEMAKLETSYDERLEAVEDKFEEKVQQLEDTIRRLTENVQYKDPYHNGQDPTGFPEDEDEDED